MAVDESEILKTAADLVARNGRNAVCVAKHQVNALARLRNQPELNTAFRVLAAVERLASTKGS